MIYRRLVKQKLMISENSDLNVSKSDPPQPPKWPDKILTYLCRTDYVDEIIGDLHEAYYWRVDTKSVPKAKRWFLWETLKSLRPGNLKSIHHFSLNTMIYRNYIKIAFRSMLKRKSVSFINIFGLSLGAAAFLLIALYSFFILNHDNQHINKENIYLVYKERITPNGVQPTYDTWVPLADRLKSDYSQVKSSARFYETGVMVIQNNRYLEETIAYTDQDFFDIFTYPLKYGNENRIFESVNSIVISAEISEKYFRTDNAIGESMEIYIPEEDTTLRFQVSAILDDYNINVSLRPEMIVQPQAIPAFEDLANEWGGSFLETYVQLQSPRHARELEASFPDLIESIWDADVKNNTTFRLLPLDDYYDTFLGRKQDAKTLLMIGIGILIIATINFMNLSTAQASQRTKEIGLRKVLGAFKGQLRSQFITEAFVSSFIAAILGAALVVLALPYFNTFFDLELSLQQYSWLELLSGVIGLTVIMGFLSGSYPAFYLSSIKAIDAIRHKMGFGGSISFRNALVVLQFAIALFLITTTIFIRNQIQYMSTKGMGFNSEGIVTVIGSRSDFVDQEAGLVRLNTLKNELKELSYVKEVTASRSIPTSWARSFTFVEPEGWTGDPMRMRYTFVDGNFFNTFNIPFKYGQNFLDDTQGDQRTSAVLNEAAMKAFDFDPANQNVLMFGDFAVNVVGVVEDFNYESLEQEIAPIIVFHRRATNPVHRFITLKMDMTDLKTKLGEIEALWNDLGSTADFSFQFMDDEIKDMYEAENRYLGMVSLFSVLSIIVACLGLYGLTLFIIEKRRKEISIRKVLGAEINEVLRLIIKDFAKWVLIAFALSIPFVIYFTNDWLESFHYRIGLSWITFGITLIAVLGLVTLTVGYQSLKAAGSNPVRYLKDE